MKKIKPFFVGLAVCLVLCIAAGCSRFDSLAYKQTAPAIVGTNVVITPAQFVTNTAPTITNVVIQPAHIDMATGIVIPGSTNTTVTPGQVTVTVTPAVTNFIPVTVPGQIQARPEVEGAINIVGALPIPFAGTIATVLGLFYSSYRNIRNKKTAVALVNGIEAFRNWSQTTPEGQRLDGKLLEFLKQHQEYAGVLNEAAALVNEHTGDTVRL